MIRVLIAENHPSLRAAMRFLLDTEQDIRVVAEARTGVEAIEKSVHYNPDVTVVDIAASVVTGVHVVRALRRERPDTAVLCLGDSVRRGSVGAVLAAGARGYLTRSAELTELQHAVRCVGSGSSYLNLSEHTNSLSRVLRARAGRVAPLSDR